jgi:serine/threonine-protein kinase SRPK3
MPRRVWAAGRHARDFFTRAGELRHIKRLRFWPLPEVLSQKYELPAAEVRQLSSWVPARALNTFSWSSPVARQR